VVTLDKYNSTIISGDITGSSGTSPNDVNVAALFGVLRTQGTPASATQLVYDDGNGNRASLTLSDPFVLSELSDLAHGLLAIGDFSQVPTDNQAYLQYASGHGLWTGPDGGTAYPTLYSPATDVYRWGWGVGGAVFGVEPPNGYGHVSPTPTYEVPGLTWPTASSGYYQYGFWQMTKTLWVNPESCPLHFQDDFTTDPGPLWQSTPQFPTIQCVTPGSVVITPLGTVIDTPWDAGQRSRWATRNFQHY
jgi:hypothetical protein